MTTSEWLDRLAPKALAVLAVGTCATYGGIHAMAGNPTGAMGVPDYLGWGWKSKAGLPIVCVPGLPDPPRQPVRDDPLPALPGDRPGADDPARRRAPADVAVRRHRPRGLRPGRVLRAGRLRHRVRLAEVHRQARLLGTRWSSATSPSAAGSTASAAAPTSAASASAARCPASPTSSCRSWTNRRAHVSRRWPAACTAAWSAACAGSPRKTVDEEPKWRAKGEQAAHRLQGRVEVTPMATTEDLDSQHDQRPRRDGVGPDHPHRRQPRHLHQDRLRPERRSPSATARRRSSAATASS